MKTLLRVLSFLAFIALLVSCDLVWVWPDPPSAVPLNEPVAFNAKFTTTFSKSIIPEGHIDLPGSVYQMVQTGTGTDDELGVFQINLTCYWSATGCTPGRSGGYLTDGTGNTIYIRCKECIPKSDLTADFPLNQTNITGRFEFTGGTGKFSGATGEGTIDCIVLNDGNSPAMSHHWQGYVKLIRP